MKTVSKAFPLLAVAILSGLAIGCTSPRETTAEQREGSPSHDSGSAAGDATTASGDATSTSGSTTSPDNTGINERDQSGALPTAQDQSESAADRETSQKVRAALVADDALSMNAKNVKVITINGVVTLRGPVNTEAEKTAIAQKAEQIAGLGKVINHLEVANPS